MEAASNPETGRVLPDAWLVLLFDGTCGPCTRAAQWVRRQDSAGRVLVQPNQAPGVLSTYGLSRAEADRSAWAVEAGSRRLEGAAALNRVLEELGGGWRLLARTYRLPLVGAAEEAVYRWLAANRGRLAWLGVTPECDRPGVLCAEA
jgi:predicted DCC family thiol-disulfide oxidoreductase YuxK